MGNRTRSFANRKALVTGATGFIGSHVVRALVSAGCEVTVLVREAARLERLRDVRDRVSLVFGDLASPQSMAAIDASCASDLVFHLGAAGTDQRSKDIDTLINVNVRGTYHLLELASRGRARRLIYAGSCTEYGMGGHLAESAPVAPRSLYGFSKAAGWMLAHLEGSARNVPIVSLRVFSPFGPNDQPHRLIPHTILCALQGFDVPLTPGDQIRDFLSIRDVVEAFLAAATTPGIDGETMNICTGQETSVKGIVTMVLRLMGDPVKPLFGQFSYRPDEPWRISGNAAKAEALLHWRAETSLEAGLRETIQWFTAYQEDYVPSTVGQGLQ